MGLLSGLINLTADVVKLPLSVASDTLNTLSGEDDEGETIENIKDIFDDIF